MDEKQKKVGLSTKGFMHHLHKLADNNGHAPLWVPSCPWNVAAWYVDSECAKSTSCSP